MADLADQLLCQKVSYKGFIHCDNPAREPNAITVEGIHKIFTSKKAIKKAQTDNPLACRGFKKPVIMTISPQFGFRLDMFSGEEAGALLQVQMGKILSAVNIEKYVYIVATRTKNPGKYLIHCMQGELKEDKVLQITKFIEVASKLHQEKKQKDMVDNKLSTLQRSNDDKIAADARIRASCFIPDEDDDPYSSKIDDYLGNGTGRDFYDEENLSKWDLREMKLDAHASGAKPGEDPVVNKQQWYHGKMGRGTAEKVLQGKAKLSFLVRFSENTKEYCISVVTKDNVVQHFATCSNADGSLHLKGHSLVYEGLVRLIDHYSRYDITSKGDRVVYPIGKNGEPVRRDGTANPSTFWA